MRFSHLYNCSCLRLLHSSPICNNVKQPASRTRDLSQHKKLMEPGNKSSLTKDPHILNGNIAISNHMRNGQCQYAHHLFDKMRSRDLVTWNIMITGYARNRNMGSARMVFDQMPDKDIVSWNTLLSGYIRNGCVDEAREVFENMPIKNSIAWNGMLASYVQNGRMEEAFGLFRLKLDWDVASWNCLMSGFVRKRRLVDARRIFDRMPKRDVVSWTTMISGHVQNGELSVAQRLFDMCPVRNVSTWNVLVSGYVQNGMLDKAKCLFEQMPQKDHVSCTTLIAGYTQCKRMDIARELFEAMPSPDIILWNTMIIGYAQNGAIIEAQRFFDICPVRNVFTWNAMVSGYVQNGMLDKAKDLFNQMPQKDSVSWNTMIAGYTQCKRMHIANELFKTMPSPDIISWNTMITGYAQSGEISQARNLFNEMPQRDCISWTAIIAGYAESGYSEEALHLFIEMKRDGERQDRSTFGCVLSACADIANLDLGKQLHAGVFKAGFESGCYVGNALLGMYCKCGCINEAYDVFEGLLEKDIVSWNTIIAGHAKHGFCEEALNLFEFMKTYGVKPDDITMVGVLSACSHTGLVDRGEKYFYSMNHDYGLNANLVHYNCMIDLLGRAGQLDKAQKLMKNMPFEPDTSTWIALLSASRLHGDTKLGEEAAEMIFKIDPQDQSSYILLSHLYAALGRWSDVDKVRLKMRNTGVKKSAGCSWIQVQNKIHKFSAGDMTHGEAGRIYTYLEELVSRMKKEGYVSSTELVLHDVEEEEKEHMLKYHSEKLAVAFGILTVPEGSPIRVFKNLRVCVDCHTAIKHISKIVGRLIILRDTSRFHHLKDGVCSCGDYW